MTFAKEVMFFASVCLGVCLFVCQQRYAKSYGRVFTKFVNFSKFNFFKLGDVGLRYETIDYIFRMLGLGLGICFHFLRK